MARGRAPRSNWQQIPRENADWENYYRTLGLPSSDPAKFEEFKKACQAELPVTFRLTGTSHDIIEVREMMEHTHISRLKDQVWDGKKLEPPQPLPFYPNRLAWQVDVAKQVIRRNPQFSEFQRFLVVETNAGNVSRQELVSMVPPLFLEVEPHHSVLDTCASPGSKTTQLIEALHASPNPSGLVIANDSDYKRSHMLTHQIKRLNSPNVIVTNHDAQMYPKVWLGDSYLKFDRILCDVPCTGDATMRKNINVWKDWKIANGLGLHNLQLNIATRSVHLLKSGGRLVYSTCSLNPIEDEAVVAHLLRQFPNLRLVDVSSKLPELKRSAGISNWKVQDKTKKEWHDLDDMGTMPRSWFRPTDEEVSKFNLDRAIRIYPEQQNSGGFFIAVLELDGSAIEVKDIEASEEARAKRSLAQENNEANASNEPAAKKAKVTESEGVSPETNGSEDNGVEEKKEERAAKPEKAPKLPRDVPAFEEPFRFLPKEHPEVQSCVQFYGIKDEFNLDTLVVRNATGDPSRTIYYVAPSLKPILENNEQKIKFIHAGIKLFNAQRNDGECKWRVQIEGISMLRPFATKRVITTSNLETLKALCLESFIKTHAMRDRDPELYAQIEDLSEGCAIWDLNGSIFPLWRGKASVNLMAPKENTEELLLRLFNIDKKQLAKENEAKANDHASGDAQAEGKELESTTEATSVEAVNA